MKSRIATVSACFVIALVMALPMAGVAVAQHITEGAVGEFEGLEVVIREPHDDQCVEVGPGECKEISLGQIAKTPNGTEVELDKACGGTVQVCVSPEGDEVHVHIGEDVKEVDVRADNDDNIIIDGGTSGSVPAGTTVRIHATDHQNITVVSSGNVELHGTGNQVSSEMTGGNFTCMNGGNTINNQNNQAGGTTYHSTDSSNVYNSGGENKASGNPNHVNGSWTPGTT